MIQSPPLRWEFVEHFDDVMQHLFCETRIDADPKQLVHDQIRIGKAPDCSIPHVAVGRLAREVASEQGAAGDLPLLEEMNHLRAGKRSIRFYRQRKAEPTWIGV